MTKTDQTNNLTSANALHVLAQAGPVSGMCDEKTPWGQSTRWLPDGTPVNGQAFVREVLCALDA